MLRNHFIHFINPQEAIANICQMGFPQLCGHYRQHPSSRPGESLPLGLGKWGMPYWGSMTLRSKLQHVHARTCAPGIAKLAETPGQGMPGGLGWIRSKTRGHGDDGNPEWKSSSLEQGDLSTVQFLPQFPHPWGSHRHSFPGGFMRWLWLRKILAGWTPALEEENTWTWHGNTVLERDMAQFTCSQLSKPSFFNKTHWILTMVETGFSSLTHFLPERAMKLQVWMVQEPDSLPGPWVPHSEGWGHPCPWALDYPLPLQGPHENLNQAWKEPHTPRLEVAYASPCGGYSST